MKLYNFYLKHDFLYYLIVIFNAFIVGIICAAIFPDNDFVFEIMIILLIISSCSVIYVPISAGKTLVNQCDPVGFLYKTDEMLGNVNIARKLNLFSHRNELLIPLINRSTAFCDIERYNDAVDIFRLLESRVKYMPPMHMAVINHNMAYICTMQGDFENARKYIEQERISFNKNKLNVFVTNKHRKAMAEFNVTSNEALIMVKCGDYENAERIYEQAENYLAVKKRIQPHTSVGVAFEVGELKYLMKKYDEAIPRLQFVVQNGGTLASRAKADEMLKKISEETIRKN